MMMAEVGDMPKVRGRSRATPETGPMPGRAPMNVPITTPASPTKRLNGLSAMEKPSTRLFRMSIAAQIPSGLVGNGTWSQYVNTP
jgi:hypothetical protein